MLRAGPSKWGGGRGVSHPPGKSSVGKSCLLSVNNTILWDVSQLLDKNLSFSWPLSCAEVGAQNSVGNISSFRQFHQHTFDSFIGMHWTVSSNFSISFVACR